MLARIFGAGPATDAFFVAFKIPNFLRRLFAEGAFSQAFIPVFSEEKQKGEPNSIKSLIAYAAGTLGGVLLILTGLGICAAPLVILVFAPGFSDDASRYQLASDMLRITFPYLFFISLTALAGGVLNSFDRFAIPALTPIFLNLSLIACAFWLAPHMQQPVVSLAWGVLVAGIIQLLFQIPFLRQIGMLSWPRWHWQHPGVQKIIKLMLPALLGSAVVQINLLLDTLIASFLIAGSVSWLYYSDRLVEFPLGVFGIALSTVILPHLSRNHAAQSLAAFSNTLDWALRLALLISLPAAIGLMMLAKPILITLFQYGEFSAHDTEMSAFSLMAYAAGLPAFILIKVLAPGFFARQDTKTPVRIGIISMCTNMIMNIAFVVPMVMLDFQAPHAGLALATAASAWIQAFLLFRRLRHEQAYQPRHGWLKLFVQTAIATIMMIILILWLQTGIRSGFEQTFALRSLSLLVLITVAITAYLVTLWLTGLRFSDVNEHA